MCIKQIVSLATGLKQLYSISSGWFCDGFCGLKPLRCVALAQVMPPSKTWDVSNSRRISIDSGAWRREASRVATRVANIGPQQMWQILVTKHFAAARSCTCQIPKNGLPFPISWWDSSDSRAFWWEQWPWPPFYLAASTIPEPSYLHYLHRNLSGFLTISFLKAFPHHLIAFCSGWTFKVCWRSVSFTKGNE